MARGCAPHPEASCEAVDPFSSSSVQLEDVVLIGCGVQSSCYTCHQSIGDLTRSPRHVGLAGSAVYVTSGVCRRVGIFESV